MNNDLNNDLNNRNQQTGNNLYGQPNINSGGNSGQFINKSNQGNLQQNMSNNPMNNFNQGNLQQDMSNNPMNNFNQGNLQQNMSNNQANYSSNTSSVSKSNKNIFKIGGIALAVIVGLFIITKLFGGAVSGGTKSGSTINQGQELLISNDFTKMSVKVESVERNIELKSYQNVTKFTKIKITMTNKGDKDIAAGFNEFVTIDGSGNKTNNGCYDALSGSFQYSNMTDAIDLNLPSGATKTGYIYCTDSSNVAKKLQITSYTSFDMEAAKQGIVKSTGSDIFYINLN